MPKKYNIISEFSRALYYNFEFLLIKNQKKPAYDDSDNRICISFNTESCIFMNSGGAVSCKHMNYHIHR